MNKVQRAIVSVSDKKGIVEFANELDKLGVEIISTGGTARILKEAGIRVKLISELTGFPEILDGRVKTLHPKVHGGLLGMRDNPDHIQQMKTNDIVPIDMVVVNLYPFEETISNEGVSLAEAIENIDIGGPAMLRSAAKNYRFSAVVVSPSKYHLVLDELKQNDCTLTEGFRFRLAQEAFAHTAHYDLMIANYLENLTKPKGVSFPGELGLTFKKVMDLRYGENPHQKAAFYGELKEADYSLVSAKQLHGKSLSYNNILDLDAASRLVQEFAEPCVVVIKHNNPCGVSVGKDLMEAFQKARDTDPVSAFGGVIAMNRSISLPLAQEINKGFVEAIVAPQFEEAALEEFKKKKNIMLMALESLRKNRTTGSHNELEVRKIQGGLLVQEPDMHLLKKEEAKVVTKRAPTDEELKALLFAWNVCKHVKSNAIVFVKGQETIGIGAGQMSRVDSVKIAIMKSQKNLVGSVMASDAFFPFRDGIDVAADAGIKAVIQPGGSIRDNEIIDACNEKGIAMVFTGVRHFRH
jgi:phosphoribosylaminoimidazolecarboxamide formyltransferase/IMP cyclohydrolase